MAEKSGELLNLEIAVKLQERFDTYSIGLIFTLLALSVQTAKFGAIPATVLELGGWLCLLIAGLAGLSRLERMPESYRLEGMRQGKQEMGLATQRAMLQGAKQFYVAPLKKEVPAEQYLAETEESVRLIGEKLDPVNRRLSRSYRTMKYSFVIGLVLLLGARAYSPVVAIIHAVRR